MENTSFKNKKLVQVDNNLKEYLLKELINTGLIQEDFNKPTAYKPLQDKVSKNSVTYFKNKIDNDEHIDEPIVDINNNILDGHHRMKAFSLDPLISQVKTLKIMLSGEDAIKLLNKIKDRYDFFSKDVEFIEYNPFHTEREESISQEDITNYNTSNLGIDNSQFYQNYKPQAPADFFGQGTMDSFFPENDNIYNQDTNQQNITDINNLTSSDSSEIIDYENDYTVYSMKPIDKNDRTGFVVSLINNNHKFEYTLSFDNLIEFEDMAYLDFLKYFVSLNDENNFYNKFKSENPTESLALQKTVNHICKINNVDGVKIGEKFIFIVN
jgi:hypothetical protein